MEGGEDEGIVLADEGVGVLKRREEREEVERW